MKLKKTKYFFLKKIGNKKYFIDFEYCDKLLLKNYIIINKLLKNTNIILYINLPIIYEENKNKLYFYIKDTLKLYGKRVIFCINDFGLLYFFEKLNIKYYYGRIIFKKIRNSFEIMETNNSLGIITDGNNKILNKNNIIIDYNKLVSVSGECKFNNCDYNCLYGEKFYGLGKKFILLGKNLYK